MARAKEATGGRQTGEVGRGQVIQGYNSQVGVWTVLRTLYKQFSCDPVAVLAHSAVGRSDETDRGNRSEGVVPLMFLKTSSMWQSCVSHFFEAMLSQGNQAVVFGPTS